MPHGVYKYVDEAKESESCNRAHHVWAVINAAPDRRQRLKESSCIAILFSPAALCRIKRIEKLLYIVNAHIHKCIYDNENLNK